MRRRLALFFLVLTLLAQTLLPGVGGFAAPNLQTTPEELAHTMVTTMSPEERIGQLFLVSVQGEDVSPESNIYDLIVNHHIGGVVLDAKNNNFTIGENTLSSALNLIQSLQQLEYAGSQQAIVDQANLNSYFPKFIPLFVGISQNGDGYPYDQIYQGLTPLPNQLAIGATWNPDLAQQVGAVAGQELSALGFNLFFGPSLDVLEDPNPDSSGDLGVRTFGGDFYWVGQMGSAYIRGMHEGSGGRMAVIAKNFPGYGGADRPPQEEVSTVRKTLEQLKQIELAAFYPVTGEALSPETAADGLLLTHIRYQGLYGNVRATTRPITFDPQAFTAIFGLPEFSSWKDAGGLIVTDDLGSQAVRRYYETTTPSFNAWEIINDAFKAGSDLLYVGNITSSTDEDSHTSILRALDIFRQKYEADLNFQLQVDRSVERILTLKFQLYETFTPDNVFPSAENLASIGESDAVALDVARQGITLLSPALDDLETVLPNTPALSDRIIFVTDTSTAEQCPTCLASSTLTVDALQQAVLRLYGLNAGNRVVQQNLFSFTFDDLLSMLDNPGDFSTLKTRILGAQWIVFSMLDVRNSRPASQALKRLLSEREDLIQNRNIIVFAFNAPYYLDTTDISKLDAYFAMYSKTPQYVDWAARILFKEFSPTFGASPITVPGIEYYLNVITQPDPTRVIEVQLDVAPPPDVTPEPPLETAEDQIPNLQPTPITDYKVGDVIRVRTSIILDHNGHPVPDDTVVQFENSLSGEIKSANTQQGIATTAFLLDRGGQLEIRAISEPALLSEPLLIDVPGPEATLVPTITPTLTPSLTPTQELTTTPVIIQPPTPPAPLHTETDLVDWGLSFLVTLTISLLAYQAALSIGQVKWSIRWALSTWIGGFLAYIYIALNLPGSTTLLAENGRLNIIWVIAIGAGLGWISGWVWKRFARKPRPLVTPESSIPAKTRSG